MSTPIVSAVILAAGVGSRLRPITDRVPKCLVPVGDGDTILSCAVRVLAEVGVTQLVVATGYRDAQVRAALRDAPMPVRFAPNPDYATTQNVVSLARALDVVEDGDVLKLDGDVLFERGIVARLIACDAPACAAVDDRALPPPDEAMKVRVEGRRIVRFSKSIAALDAAGESIGIERVRASEVSRLREALKRAISSGRTDVYYEDVYNDLVDEGFTMLSVSVGDLSWTEIDDADDLAYARRCREASC